MVVVKLYKAIYQNAQEVIDKILSDFPLDVKAKKVLIKPNMLSSHKPEEAVTTHPAVIRALTKAVLDRGGIVTVGDNPCLVGHDAVKRCAQITGLEGASLGHFVDISRTIKKISIASKNIEILVSKYILEADIIINVPKFKTHAQTTLTGAIKNMLGALPGNEKSRMHYLFPTIREFCSILLDVYCLRPPDLNIMDAIVIMDGNGPAAGRIRSGGRLIASYNAAALDWVMALMANIKPEKVELIKQSLQRKLFKKEELAIEGDFYVIKDFKLPPAHILQMYQLSVVQRVLNRPSRRKVVRVNPDLCDLCGECAKICPANAIKINDAVKIKKDICIACLCCHEACPNGAIGL